MTIPFGRNGTPAGATRADSAREVLLNTPRGSAGGNGHTSEQIDGERDFSPAFEEEEMDSRPPVNQRDQRLEALEDRIRQRTETGEDKRFSRASYQNQVSQRDYHTIYGSRQALVMEQLQFAEEQRKNKSIAFEKVKIEQEARIQKQLDEKPDAYTNAMNLYKTILYGSGFWHFKEGNIVVKVGYLMSFVFSVLGFLQLAKNLSAIFNNNFLYYLFAILGGVLGYMFGEKRVQSTFDLYTKKISKESQQINKDKLLNWFYTAVDIIPEFIFTPTLIAQSLGDNVNAIGGWLGAFFFIAMVELALFTELRKAAVTALDSYNKSMEIIEEAAQEITARKKEMNEEVAMLGKKIKTLEEEYFDLGAEMVRGLNKGLNTLAY